MAEGAEPRRSARVAAQPAPAAPSIPAPKPRTKKRAAQDDEGGSKTAKKAKAAEKKDEDEDAEKDELEGDGSIIEVGDILPSMVLKNEKDEDVDVTDLVKEKHVVIFLVPKADTPGCTTQACGFRDIYPDFTSVNADVYCLSADSPAAQTKWQTKKELPYPLLSDPKRELIKALGAGKGNKTQRSHFVFEKGGKLVDKKIPVKPADSPKQALEFVKTLA